MRSSLDRLQRNLPSSLIKRRRPPFARIPASATLISSGRAAATNRDLVLGRRFCRFAAKEGARASAEHVVLKLGHHTAYSAYHCSEPGLLAHLVASAPWS
jgi:hypothetical protein